MLTREQIKKKAMKLEDYDDLAVEIYNKDPKLAQERLEDELTRFEDTQDPRCLLSTMRQIAQAQGITHVGEVTGLTRSAIYKALSQDGNPQLTTLLAILQALGYTFAFKRVLDAGSVVDLEQRRREEKLEAIKLLVNDLEQDLQQDRQNHKRQYA